MTKKRLPFSGFLLWGVVTILILLLVISSLLLGTLVYYRNRVLPGVSLAGVDISGMHRDEIHAKLSDMSKAQPPTLTFRAGQNSWDVDLAEWNIVLDEERTTEQAVNWGKNWEAWKQRKHIRVESANLPVVYSLEEQKVEQALHEISNQVWVPAFEPEVYATESAVLVKQGTVGQQLESQKVKNDIYGHLAYWNFEPIDLSIQTIDFRVSERALEEARQRGERLLAKQLRLDISDSDNLMWGGDKLISLLSPMEGFRNSRLVQETELLAETVNRSPQNAVFVFDEEEQRVKEFAEEQQGLELNEESFQGLLLESLRALEREATDTASIRLPLEVSEPEIGVAQINDLGIEELIAEGESTFKGSIASRVHNVSLAASRLDGALVPPGEVISFNGLVGEISRATGYQTAYVIQGGRTVLGDGGGVCQVSTTLFRAALNAGLPIEERKAHSYRVGYYEQDAKPGLDATIYSPVVDLKILNDTPAYILVKTEFDKENYHLKFKLYGKSDGRKAEITNHTVWDVIAPAAPLYQDDPTLPVGQVKQVEYAANGTKASFDWKVYNADGSLKEEKTFYSNFRPWRAVFLQGTGPVI